MTKLLKISPGAIRSPITSRPLVPAHVQGLAESMEREGQQTPISVFSLPEPPPGEPQFHYILADGAHRLAAAVKRDAKEIDAVVLGVYSGEAQVRQAQLNGNVIRESMTALQEAEAIEKLVNDAGGDASSVADKMGRPVGFILSRLALLALTAEGRQALEAGEITLTHAVHLARVGDPEAQNGILEQVRGGRDWRGRKAEGGEYIAPKDSDFTARLVAQVQRDLGKVPWKLNEVFGQCGACDICPHNSRNRGELFQDQGAKAKQICGNAPCFQDKLTTSNRAARRAAGHLRREKLKPTPTTIGEAKAAKDAVFVTDAAVRDQLSRLATLARGAGKGDAGEDGRSEIDKALQARNERDSKVREEMGDQRQRWMEVAQAKVADKLMGVPFAAAYLFLLCRSNSWKKAHNGRMRGKELTAFKHILKGALTATSADKLAGVARAYVIDKKVGSGWGRIEKALRGEGYVRFENDEDNGILLLMVEVYGIPAEDLPKLEAEKDVRARLFPPEAEKPKAAPVKKKAGKKRGKK